MSKKKEIKITIDLDDQNIPEQIEWEATDSGVEEAISCRSLILSLWDHQNKDTLRLDLWTRNMTQDEMKIFFHQTLVTMADSLMKAINDERIVGDMRDFCDYFAERMNIVDSK